MHRPIGVRFDFASNFASKGPLHDQILRPPEAASLVEPEPMWSGGVTLIVVTSGLFGQE